ncbi:hypothetical protein NL676_038242 [Syzygium grande]|nr:hypothetical protein NL676_038242 [Syzygium grande]
MHLRLSSQSMKIAGITDKVSRDKCKRSSSEVQDMAAGPKKARPFSLSFPFSQLEFKHRLPIRIQSEAPFNNRPTTWNAIQAKLAVASCGSSTTGVSR